MIVIKNNPTSLYYSEYCKPSWRLAGIDPISFDATIPDQLYRYSELTFSKYNRTAKYTRLGILANLTETEKACWYSHFRLWQEACFRQEPIIILEHDSYLEEPSKLWYDDKYGMIFYDKAAMGSYLIQPWFAKELIMYAMGEVIDGGPFSFIHKYAVKHKLEEIVVNDRHKKYTICSNQVMSEKHGSTVDHWSSLHPELFSSLHVHQFKQI